MFSANQVSNEKVTHVGRPFAAQTARRNGATVADAKALGGWSDSGSYRACYERSLPLSAIWAVAGFNGSDLDSYFVPRAELSQLYSPIQFLNHPFINLHKTKILQIQNRPRSCLVVYFLGLRMRSKLYLTEF